MAKTRINLANRYELAAVPEFDSGVVDAILQHRVEHGPIADAAQLEQILGAELPNALLDRLDFAPAKDSATESAGG